MRTRNVDAIDRLLERYLRDSLKLDLQSSLGRVDEAASSWSSGDDRLVKYMTVCERWAWLFRGLSSQDIALALNEALAKAFRRKSTTISTRHGRLDIEAEGIVERMSEHELARAAGLSLYQYRRRLTKVRSRLLCNVSDHLFAERAA